MSLPPLRLRAALGFHRGSGNRHKLPLVDLRCRALPGRIGPNGRQRASDATDREGTRMRRGRRFAMTLALAVTMGAVLVTSAGASTVTVGSPLTATFAPVEFPNQRTIFNSALPESGAFVTSPVTGAIVRWRIVGASGGPFKLRVLTPGSANTYTGAGTSGGGLPTSTAVQTFATVLPIKVGQTIGLDNTASTDKIGQATVGGASFGFIKPPVAEGATASGTELPGEEVGFNADIQPLPVVTQLTPTAGSIVGGTSVVIAGTDFVGVKSVTFGGVPATSYTVDSAGQITAVSPAAPRPNAVDVGITTVAGRSVVAAADKFTYKACVVPKLKGKALKVAKKRLRKAGCKLGKVKGDLSAGGKATVVRQSIAAGKVRPPATKVSVTVH
ncbi:MAG: PASTA domain-containing protein [Solirubrobacterales bacterium]